MSHRHTVIEPAAGLTVLVGPNNCGKSAVITALQILANNENSTYVTRHGEKRCSVTVHTDDGHEITWLRKNSSTSYVIDGELFDRLRNGVPDKLTEVLRLPKVELNPSKDQIDIHFGLQKHPVFLLNESGKTAAGFFAASSDAGRLIEMQRVHKERVRRRKQDAKRLEDEADLLRAEVEKLANVDRLAELFKQCEQNKSHLAAADQRAQQLAILIKKISTLIRQRQRCLKQQDALTELRPAPEPAPAKRLGNLIDRVNELARRAQAMKQRKMVTAELNSPPELPSPLPLRKIIDQLQALTRHRDRAQRQSALLESLPRKPETTQVESARSMFAESSLLLSRITRLQTESAELASRLNAVQSQIEQFADEHATCPTCRQPLESKRLVQHLSGKAKCDET